MSNSQDVRDIVGGFARQVRGLLPGLEKFPSLWEELETRERASDAREQEDRDRDAAAAQKEKHLTGLGKAIEQKEAALKEREHRLRNADAQLAALAARETEVTAREEGVKQREDRMDAREREWAAFMAKQQGGG